MPAHENIRKSPWDTRAFGIECFEVVEPSEQILRRTEQTPGHYTAKVEPLASKKLLHDHGFYYCDTLLEPFVDRQRFIPHPHEQVELSREISLEKLVKICHGAFHHGRFHRDFNLDPELADVRYDNWLRQIHREGGSFTLLYEKVPAAFFCFNANHIVLHAVAHPFQGRGLAKHLWSRGCQELFSEGHRELTSSVSASNTAVVNLYASLGFRFRNPTDVYHKFVP